MSGGRSIIFVIVALMVAGCSHPETFQPSGQAGLTRDHQSTEDRSVLAGEWEYEDGGVLLLRLDEQGNGTYSYKDGRFETTHLEGRTWMGKWYQKENDREGGFQVRLSSDYMEGEGTWWYVRIGADSTPSEKGGTFHLTRKTSLTNLSDTPPAP
jgi:hypothetical protein